MRELAQGNIDWVEIGIFLVVIGIAVFKAVGQALIKKFSPDEKIKKKRDRVGPLTLNPDQSSRQPSDRPVARPLPPRPRPVVARPAAERPERTKRPDAFPIPDSLRDILSEVVPELIPARPKDASKERPVAQPVPTQQFPAKPVAKRNVSKSRREVKQRDVRKRDSRRGKVVDHAPDDRLGHLETELVDGIPGSAGRQASVDDPYAVVRRPSRESLRYAIVMKEILGPPIALRENGDHLM